MIKPSYHSLGSPFLILSCLLFGLGAMGANQVVTWGAASLPPGGITNVAAIAGGLNYSLALKADGTVVGWNSGGSFLTNVPAGLSNVVAIAAGGFHSLALKSDGAVVAWGNNSSGETNVPPGLTNVIAVACGNGHSVALTAAGTVAVWGADFAGQTNVPSDLTNATAIAAGGWDSYALKLDGTVVGWEYNTFGETAVPPDLTNAVAIAAGFDHVLAIRNDGTVVTWGINSYGLANIPAEATNVAAIAGGESHSLVLKADGTVVAWGANHSGQASVPPGLSNVVAIAGGAYHSLAIQNDGAPFISRQPLNQSAYSGTVARLTVGATGNSPLSYRWQKDGTNLLLSASGILAIPNVQAGNAGVYTVTVTNQNGTVTSSNAILTVLNSLPIITRGLTNQTIYGSSNALLAVAAKGSQPMSYQWQLEGTNLAGATSAALTVTNLQWSNTGAYSVVVSNAFGAATNSAQLTLLPLTITAQPQARTVLGGGTASFAVAATGKPPFHYQWQFNTGGLPGATANPLVLTNVQMAQAGYYSVAVSNDFGGAVSGSALLTVLPFQITNQPQSQFGFLGSTISLSVGVTGQSPFAYQWRKAGFDLPGATNSTLMLTNVGVADARLFSVVVSNQHGTITSSNATITFNAVAVWGNNSVGQTNVPISATSSIGLAAGDYHFLALQRNGTVVAWGDNSYGQRVVPSNVTNAVQVAAGGGHSLAALGDGTVSLWGRILGSFSSTVPAAASNVVALALGPGALHALALRMDGSVVDWGYANYGLTNPPALASHVVGVAAGSSHSLALRSDGRVVAWGNNSSGQINVPASATNIVAVAAGWNHSAALRANGTVVVWGSISVPPASATNVIDIAAGGNHQLALRRDGTMVAWGSNSDGQSTVPKFATNVSAIAGGSYNSMALGAMGAPLLSGGLTNIVVNAGTTNFLRLKAVGALPLTYQWSVNGTNIDGATNAVLTLTNIMAGQAGSYYRLIVSNRFGVVPSEAIYLTVVPLEVAVQPASQSAFFGSNATLTAVTAGKGPFTYQWKRFATNLPGATHSSLTLTNIGMDQAGIYSVEASNSSGTVTSGNASIAVVPLFVTAQPQSQSVLRWTSATLGVGAGGAPPVRYQWRLNGTNLAGATNSTFVIPAMQAGDAGAYTVAITNDYAGLISSTGTVRMATVAAWGATDCGLLSVPASASNVIGIAAGWVNAIALRANGSVVVWGCNDAGQNNVPAAATNVVSVVGGYRSFSVLRADGTVVGWGLNESGESNAPPTFTNAVQIAGVISHRLGLRADGTAIGWGYNGYGVADIPANPGNLVGIAGGYNHSAALRADGTVIAWGLGDLNRTNLPSDLTNAVAIAAGNNHTLALRADGSVTAWGENTSGQTNVPPTLTNAVAIAGGWQHSLALRADGTVVAWGDNGYGQLGVPAGLTNVIAIAAGGYFNLALIGDGPPNPSSAPFNASWSSNVFHVSLPSRNNYVYRLESKNDLSNPIWQGFPLAPGTGAVLNFADPSATGIQRFYRVRRW